MKRKKGRPVNSREEGPSGRAGAGEGESIYSLQRLLQPQSQRQLPGETERPLGLCRGFSIWAVSAQRKNTSMKAGDNLILQTRMKENRAHKLGLSICLTF